MDNVDYPHNKDDASYGEPISGVEDHGEEPHHEENTDGHHQGQPPETQYTPTAEHTMPTDTQTTNGKEYVQEDEVGNSQELDITNANNETKEETGVQKAPI